LKSVLRNKRCPNRREKGLRDPTAENYRIKSVPEKVKLGSIAGKSESRGLEIPGNITPLTNGISVMEGLVADMESQAFGDGYVTSNPFIVQGQHLRIGFSSVIGRANHGIGTGILEKFEEQGIRDIFYVGTREFFAVLIGIRSDTEAKRIEARRHGDAQEQTFSHPAR